MTTKVDLLSFEAIYKGNKIICNSGYFQNQNHKLNIISRSTVAHSTLILNNKSASSFKKNKKTVLENGLKSINSNIIFQKKISEHKRVAQRIPKRIWNYSRKSNRIFFQSLINF